MKQIRSVNDIKQLGTILSVWAHPDDESFSCAGIMCAAIQNNQDVICVTATKGEAGVQDESRWPASQLGDIRAREMKQALSCLGLRKHHWLGYLDGHCHEVPIMQAVDKIRHFIDTYKPDTILTFGPDGITGHSDHQAVSEWVRQATAESKIVVYHSIEEEQHYEEYMKEADRKFNIYFNIDKPPVRKAADCDITFNLPPDVIAKKQAALRAMPSQTEAMFRQTSPEMMDSMLARECFVLAK